MTYKRKRSGTTPRYLKRPTKKARKTRFTGRAGITRVVSKMINRNVETKESQERACTNLTIQNCPHNNILLVQNVARSATLNPFTLSNGTDDPMDANSGSRIGDQITLKGMCRCNERLKAKTEGSTPLFWNDHLDLRIITGGYTIITYVDVALCRCFSL
jgi:hypothetical protein